MLPPVAVVVPHATVLPLAVVVPPVAVVVLRRRVARRPRFAASSCRSLPSSCHLSLCCPSPSSCRPSPCCPVPKVLSIQSKKYYTVELLSKKSTKVKSTIYSK